MKVRFVFVIAACAWIVSAACAQENNWVHVKGTATAAADKSHGNDAVGGSSGGMATGSFSAKGPCKAGGIASANAKAGGSDSTNSNGFTTNSAASINSSAQSRGFHNKDTVQGSVGQANWGGTGDNNNFAAGSNETNANYKGKVTALHDPKISGSANSTGKTTGWVNDTANANSSGVTSSGSSEARLGSGKEGNRSGNVEVDGNGAVGTGSTLGGGSGQNFYAGAVAQGSTGYKASGDKSAWGSQSMCGTTKTTYNGNTVQSSSTMWSSAKTGGH